MTTLDEQQNEDIQEEDGPFISNAKQNGLTVKRKKGLVVSVNRPCYTQAEFDDALHPSCKKSKTAKERCNDFCSKCVCTKTCIVKCIFKVFPFLHILQEYSVKDDLMNDVVSGLTVGIMHIPQGMAYGMLTNLPPVYGLYVSFFPVLLYFFLGHSRHNSMGTFAVVSLMVGTVVEKGVCSPSLEKPIDNGTDLLNLNSSNENSTLSLGRSGSEMSDEELQCKVGWAMAVTFMAGLYQIAMGVFQLGFITIYMSEPLTRAFTTGAAIYVFTSQVKHVVGIKTGTYNGALKLVYTYIDLFSNITSINFASLIMSVICMVAIYLTKEFINPRVKAKIKMPFPIELVVIILGTLVSYLAKFSDRFGMKVVGLIPSGIPPPAAPPLSRLGSVAGDAVGIAIVAFAVNISMGQLFAKKHSYVLPANGELVAYGVTNTAGSFLNCYASAASLSRSLIQEGVGGKTQIAGLVSCCLLIVVLFGIGPLFEQLPNNVLAAIVIVNLKGMFLQFLDLKRLWRISKYDFCIWLVTFIAVCLVDVDMGLLAGVVFSLLTVVFRTQSPYTCLMGRVPHTDIYKDIKVYHKAEEIPGIKIFRFESSLYYANSEHFVEKLFHKTGVNPRKLRAKQVSMEKKKHAFLVSGQRHAVKNKSTNYKDPPAEELAARFPIPQPQIHVIIVDCSAMSYLDAVAVSTLSQVIEEYKAVGVTVLLSGCKAGIREMLEAAGFFQKVLPAALYPTVHDAVLLSVAGDRELRDMIEADIPRMQGAASLYQMTKTPSFTSINIRDADDGGDGMADPLIQEDEV